MLYCKIWHEDLALVTESVYAFLSRFVFQTKTPCREKKKNFSSIPEQTHFRHGALWWQEESLDPGAGGRQLWVPWVNSAPVMEWEQGPGQRDSVPPQSGPPVSQGNERNRHMLPAPDPGCKACTLALTKAWAAAQHTSDIYSCCWPKGNDRGMKQLEGKAYVLQLLCCSQTMQFLNR